MTSGSSTRSIISNLSIVHNLDCIPRPYDALGKHTRVEPAPARVSLLRDPLEISFAEPLRIQLTRSTVTGHFQTYLRTNVQQRPRTKLLPFESSQGEVFPGRTGINGVSFVLQPFDQLEREQADCSIRPAVHVQIFLPITAHPLLRHLGFNQRILGYTAVRDIDLMDMRIRRTPVFSHPYAPSHDCAGLNSSASHPSRSRS